MWKARLMTAIDAFEDRIALGAEYAFGPPATDDEILALESALGRPIPEELRELWLEFNGVRYRDACWGDQRIPLYFSTQDITGALASYFAETDNVIPDIAQRARVAFFAQQNGMSVLYAICVDRFGGFAPGQVLVLDSEAEAFEFHCDTLAKFVSEPAHCSL